MLLFGINNVDTISIDFNQTSSLYPAILSFPLIPTGSLLQGKYMLYHRIIDTEDKVFLMEIGSTIEEFNGNLVDYQPISALVITWHIQMLNNIVSKFNCCEFMCIIAKWQPCSQHFLSLHKLYVVDCPTVWFF